MQRLLLFIGLCAALLIGVAPSVQSGPEARKDTAPTALQGQGEAGAPKASDRSADETAIRENVASFVRAYNARDSKAVAAFFTADGQIVDKEGNASEGRAAIAQTFADLFTAS